MFFVFLLFLYFIVPSSPVNLTLITITNSGLIMQWNKPEAPNGNISGYRLFYAAEQFTNVKTINSSADIVTGEIEGLGNFLSFICILNPYIYNNATQFRADLRFSKL